MSEQYNSLEIKFKGNIIPDDIKMILDKFCKKWDLKILGENPVEFNMEMFEEDFSNFRKDLEKQLNKIAKKNSESSFLCLYSESWPGIGEEYSYVYFKDRNVENIICKEYEYSIEFYELETDFDNGVLCFTDLDSKNDEDMDDPIKTIVHLFGDPYVVNREDCEKFIVKRTSWTKEDVKKMSSREIDEWINEADVCAFLDRYHSEKISEEDEEKYNTDAENDHEEIVTFEVAGTMHRNISAVRKAAYCGASVCLIPEPTNPYDSDAIRVESEDGIHLGYVPSDILSEIDDPNDYECEIISVTEGYKAPFITVEAKKLC